LNDCGEEVTALPPSSIGGSGTVTATAMPFAMGTLRGDGLNVDRFFTNCRGMVVGRVYTAPRQAEIRRATSIISL